MSSQFLHLIKIILSVLTEAGNINVFGRPDVRKTTKRTGFGRDGEKHVEPNLDAGQSFYSLVLFSVDMYFRANVTDDDFYLLNKNNSNMMNRSSPVFRSGLVVWRY